MTPLDVDLIDRDLTALKWLYALSLALHLLTLGGILALWWAER